MNHKYIASMNHKYIASTIFVAIILFTPAQANTSVSGMIFKITQTYTVPALTPKDSEGNKSLGEDPVYENEYSKATNEGELQIYEYRSKMSTFKVTNKVILEALVEAGVIDLIAGWSIVFIDTHDDAYLALQRGNETISLQGIIDFDVDAFAEQFKESEILGDGYYKANGSGKYKATVEIDVELEGGEIEMQGILSSSEKLRKFGKGDDTSYVWLANRRKVTSISGHMDLDDAGYNSVLQGSVIIKNSKLAQLE